jgi:hypothetical protein
MLLDDDIIAFLECGSSISVASRSQALIPSVSRVKGCRVLRGDKIRLRFLLSIAEAGDLLDDVRTTRVIAATFSDVNSHKTLQLKGRDAIIDTLRDDDIDTISAYEISFGSSLLSIGFPRQFTHAFLVAESTDNFAIEFSPSDLFLQTPGPNAGNRLLGE